MRLAGAHRQGPGHSRPWGCSGSSFPHPLLSAPAWQGFVAPMGWGTLFGPIGRTMGSLTGRLALFRRGILP